VRLRIQIDTVWLALAARKCGCEIKGSRSFADPSLLVEYRHDSHICCQF
jgi:hypothetical protein